MSNHPLNRHFAKKLRELRFEKGVSSKELAERISTEMKEVNAYEQGGRILSAAYLYMFARALDVPIERFFEGVDPSIPLVGTRNLLRSEVA